MPTPEYDNDLIATGGGQGFPPDNKDGTPGLVGPDEYTKQLRIHRILSNNTTVVGGNYADLQRMGAEAATGKGQAGIAGPPGTDLKDDKVVSPAQAEAARGEWTRETERTGLLTEPPAADPPENKSPNPVDPTSTSPTTQASGQSTPSAASSPKANK